VFTQALHHRLVPRDPGENALFRLALLRACKEDGPTRRAAIKACREDCLFYINSFVCQYNPSRLGREVGPFVTWPRQDELVLWILDHVRRGRDGLIEKSRDVGASWLNLIVEDWACSFHDWKKFLNISHTEDAVDRGDDPGSLFWKISFVHDHRPLWLLPAQPVKKKMGFVYPATNSRVTGAATTERSGVGDRGPIFLDEFSKQRNDFDILGQTADTGSRIFNGTHYGTGTAFYELSRRPDLDKFVLHWSHHPEKARGLYRFDAAGQKVEVLDKSYEYPPNFKFVTDGRPTGGPFPGLRSPWYDEQCIRRASPRDVAMHLDIDPQGSTSQFFDPPTIRSLQREFCRDPVWEGDLQYDADSATVTGFAPRPGGPLKMWSNRQPDDTFPAARYGAGCDISTGTGATNSCLSVASADTGERVLEYTSPRVPPDKFAVIVVSLCRMLRSESGDPAYLAWETQGPGSAFGRKVIELGYRHFFYRVAESTLNPRPTDLPGWYPSVETTYSLLEDYRSALYSKQFVNRSEIALSETLDFRYLGRGEVKHAGYDSKNDPSGAGINHGDRVIADALANKMIVILGLGARRRIDDPAVLKPSMVAYRQELASREAEQEGVW
jgi:hypothetical protein